MDENYQGVYERCKDNTCRAALEGKRASGMKKDGERK